MAVRDLILLAFILVSCAISGVLTEAHVHGYLYRRTLVNKTNVGEYLSLNGTIKDLVYRSKTDCVRSCVGLGRQCGAAEFDELCGYCGAGASVVQRNGAPVPHKDPSTVFYSRPPEKWDVEQGFKYIAGSEENVCIFLSESKAHRDLDRAQTICENKGGSLYMMKSIEKFSLLDRNTNGYLFGIWVGLKEWESDQVEKTFYWDDGEQFMRNDSLWNIFWRPGQPASVSYICVEAREDNGSIKHKELHCGYSRRYACEMPPYLTD